MVNYFLLCHFIIYIEVDMDILLGGTRIITRVQIHTISEGSNLDKSSISDEQSDLDQIFKQDTIKGGRGDQPWYMKGDPWCNISRTTVIFKVSGQHMHLPIQQSPYLITLSSFFSPFTLPPVSISLVGRPIFHHPLPFLSFLIGTKTLNQPPSLAICLLFCDHQDTKYQ